jgi:hypothetical protein
MKIDFFLTIVWQIFDITLEEEQKTNRAGQVKWATNIYVHT